MNTVETGVAAFPVSRLRRLRMTEALRGMVRETTLNAKDFIYPLFVVPGRSVRKPVSSMPGVFQLSVENIVRGEVIHTEIRTLVAIALLAQLMRGGQVGGKFTGLLVLEHHLNDVE